MTTLNKMRIQRDVMALESNLTSTAMSNLSSLVTSFTDFVSTTAGFSISTTAGVIALNSNQRDFLAKVEKLNFRDLELLTAYVPEGMNEKYANYVSALNPSAEYCAENTLALLNTLSTYVANLINNNHALLDTHSFVAKLAKHEKERADLNAEVGKCFAKGSSIAQRKIGNVIDRNADWKLVFEEITLMNRTIDSVDKNKIYKKMNEINELLEVFKRKFNNGEIKEVSNEVSQNLSNLLYQAASELEFFSVTFFRVLAFTTSVNRTTEYVQKMFKH